MITTLNEAMSQISSGSNLFIQTAAAAPQKLIKGLMDKATDLRDITIYQMHTEGPAPYAAPEFSDVFKVNCFFIGANLR